MTFKAITISSLRAFVLMMAIFMPLQAVSMTIATINSPCMKEGGASAHCKNMQMKQASSAMDEPCKMRSIAKNDSNQSHSNQQNKHTSIPSSQKSACCTSAGCSAMFASITLANIWTFEFNHSTSFSAYLAPYFYSQSPDGLERPPRTLS